VLSFTRIRQSAALFGAILAVVALIAALAVGMVGFLAQQATDGVRAGLESRAGSDLAFRPALRIATNPEKQDAEVRAAVVSSFAPTGVDMAVSRSVEMRVSLRTTADDGTETESIGLAASYQDLEDRVQLVDGTFGEGTNEVIVQEQAAADLGLEVGDQLLIEGARFTVVGTWRAIDFLDPRWYGDPMIVTGLNDDHGPFVIDERAWSRFDDLPRVRWTLIPDIADITSSNLAEVAEAWFAIDSDWRGEVDGLETLEKQGRFAQTAEVLGVRVTGLAAIQPVVLLLLAAIAIVALAELGRLLAATRAEETALIWSRGASSGDLAVATAIEVGIAATLGMLLGGAAGVGALVLSTGGTDVLGSLGVAAWAVPVAGAVSAAGLAAFSSYRSAGRQTVRDPSDASGRARRLTAPGLVALVVAAAALTVWQLRLYGSPVTPSADGGSAVDPIAVVAPALALIAVVLVVVLVFPLLAGVGDRLALRQRVTAQLAARTVARRVSLAAAPLVVVALATGSTVVSAVYAETWTRSFDVTSALRSGADLHVSSRVEGIGPTAVDDVAALPGVELTGPIEVQPLSLGGESGSIVAASPDAVAEVATTASGTFDRDAAAEAVRVDLPAPVLSGDTRRIELDVQLENFVTPPAVGVWIVDRLGTLRLVPLDPVPAEVPDAGIHTVVYAADVPAAQAAAPAPWRVLSMDIRIPESAVVGVDTFAHLSMTSLTATMDAGEVDVPLDQYWLPDSSLLQFSPPNADGTGHGFVAYSDTLAVRLTPSFDGTFDDRISPKVLVSERLAELFDVAVGDTLSFPIQDGFDRLNAEVAGVVPAIPGAPFDTALLMDLTVIQHYQLRISEEPARPRDVWVSTGDPEQVTEQLRTVFPANAQILSAGDPAGRQVLGSAAMALWAGSGICGILALIGVAAAARAQLRSRRGEIAVLRAIGLGSGAQASIRMRELVIVLGTGLLAGLLAGGIVSSLTVPQLARAAIPDPYPAIGTSAAIDLPALGLALGAFIVALAVIVAISGAGVAALARRAVPTEGVS
jgi:hypothetical protein